MHSSFARLGLAALTLVAVWACGGAPLGHTAKSPVDVAAAVLDALERRDLARLRELAVNEQEFREHVWPDLPAARPERNLPFSYVWGDLHQKSEASLTTTLAMHGGRRYKLVDVRFDGVTTKYPSYAVHRKAVVTVESGGAEVSLRLFGSLLEQAGEWKVFSYVTD